MGRRAGDGLQHLGPPGRDYPPDDWDDDEEPDF